MPETPDVRVGQIWQDNDPRVTPARFLRVTAINGDKATCEAWYDKPGSQARTVRISLARFRPTSTGYRLHEEAPDHG
jgi:hypothetical protein